jgi:arylsulfatase A-like enzyme/Tfp pilus assembly protein PilF
MSELRAVRWSYTLLLGGAWLCAGCFAGSGSTPPPASGGSARPSILLVTLDTTRADAIGPGAAGVETPAFDALASRGMRFSQAYATAPETLPSHASIMTGLYAAGHGVHENARPLPTGHPVLAERLRQAGYHTAAFVSSFVLARRFGLARGFDGYDDELPAGQSERSAAETTTRSSAFLVAAPRQPLFVWVHYYDPHHPYRPPEPFRSRYAKSPYLGEVAAMDAELGRLVQAFERHAPGPAAYVVVGDHGEGLGDHGESQHGKLLYQATIRVPLLAAGPGLALGVSDAPVSSRRVFHTILDWAGLEAADSLRVPRDEIVLGEGMKPFLAYGWQPQVMAVEGSLKVIQAGAPEVYDLSRDPGEARDLAASTELSRPLRTSLREYPVPSLAPKPAPALGEEERRQLASLGYVSAGAAPVVRADAPRPAAMAPLFDTLDTASTLFVREEYARVIPLLRKILAADSHNLDAALRLATAHSALGQPAQAEQAFDTAARIAPGSPDVRVYRALHYSRGPGWERAVPLLEQVVAESPDRLPAVEALARLRERQGQAAEALALWQRVEELRPLSAGELVRVGGLAMRLGQTTLATVSLEKARSAQGTGFVHDLELGVLYLAARRLPDARDALDRVPASHPGYPMALFKRAQVSVLLGEPDRAERIEAARKRADATTRELIARERLFAPPTTAAKGNARGNGGS